LGRRAAALLRVSDPARFIGNMPLNAASLRSTFRPTLSCAMGACVLLLHELSDGDSHYDWLIDPGPTPPEPSRSAETGPGPLLLAFRIQERIDQKVIARFEAHRLADHRRLYLSFEGTISGGRGRVRRLATGALALRENTPDALIAVGRIGPVEAFLAGRRVSDAHWLFRGSRPDPGKGVELGTDSGRLG
jgi:hypothetical protein